MADKPALYHAAATGAPVLPLFVVNEEHGIRLPGGASLWWLRHSLESLDASLKILGNRLILRSGPSADTLASLVERTNAQGVFWNRRYGSAEIALDASIKSMLRERGLIAESFNGALLFEPWTVTTKAGTPMKVFTPFWARGAG